MKDYSDYMNDDLPIPERDKTLDGIAIGCAITLVIAILATTIGLLIFIL